MHKDFQKIVKIIIKIYAFYGFLCLLNEKKIINIDNIINESSYQKDFNFSQYKAYYKVLVIFYPDNYTNKICDSNPYNKINLNYLLIEKQVKLAKNHGIFGFGVVYNWLDYIYNGDLIYSVFSCLNELNFPFFIILIFNLNYDNQIQNSLIQNNIYNKTQSTLLLKTIINYFKSSIYIKYKGKPILGIYNSSSIKYLYIRDIRQYEKKYNITNSFIISIEEGTSNTTDEVDCEVEFLSHKKFYKSDIYLKYFYNFYYYSLLKNENNIVKPILNFFIINGCKPEKFYIIFKKYLNLAINVNVEFILFNAWNNYLDKFYLQPNDEFGFSYLNYFSKAIFNLNYEFINDLSSLNDNCKIAVQVHLFYDDLIEYIINKTNNIPTKFDLYISITSNQIYSNLEKYINKYSNCSHYQILIVENRGRDVLPFLNQMKSLLNNYKYICHMHSKKTKQNPELGFLWRNYLFNNLLGNVQIVREILNDFENNEKIGFIYPESFYRIIYHLPILFADTKKWMNFLFDKLFPNYQIGHLSNFPAGNMFWAKVNAIYQIFEYNFTEYFPYEEDQIEKTIMHAIERIWLYLVKINGYYYKIIFKQF